MNSPRTAAKLCWIFTLVSFVGVGIGLYTTINTITYLSLGALVIFMIILPMFVCRCPYCGKHIMLGVLAVKDCPRCRRNLATGKKIKKRR